MPKKLDPHVEDILKNAGVEPLAETDPVPERSYYLEYLKVVDLSEADQVKELNKRKAAYFEVFHLWVAYVYPNLVFERTDEKTYWNYDPEAGVYIELSLPEVKSLVTKLLLEDELSAKANESSIKTIMTRYRGWYGDRGVGYDDFDSSDEWFHAHNGWVHLDTLRFESHTPKRLSRRKSAVAYEKGATCPRYDKFLDEDLQLAKDQVRVIDQFSGVSLTNDIRHQKMLTLTGRPGCGKSTLMETWDLVLGDMMIEKKLTELQGDAMRFAGSQFVGATLCWFDEVDVKKSEMGNNLGTLITGNTINVERKGINGIVKARNTVKCVLTANKLPNTAEVGMFRRLIIIPIQVSFTDGGVEDHKMREKLHKEASGILNRMIRGLHDIRKMGKYTMIEGHEELVEDYKASSDTIAEFLDTYFDPAPGDEWVETQVMLDAYLHFTEGNRWSRSLTIRKFAYQLQTQSLTKFASIQPSRKAVNRVMKRGWSGLKLKPGLQFETETNVIINAIDRPF